jgi:hypothetical protein
MARKRAPGGGRKPQGEYPSKSQQFTTRITPATKRALVEAAVRSGRSLSQEVEKRLNATVVKPSGAPHNRALALAVAYLAESIELETQRDWRQDAFTAMGLRAGIEALLVRYAAAAVENPEVPPAIERQVSAMPPSFAEQYRMPIHFGLFKGNHLTIEIEKSKAPGERYSIEDFDEWSVPFTFDAPADVLGQIRRNLKEGKQS